MSSAPSGWATPYTSWTSNDGIANTDLNRIEDNTEAIELGDRTLTPAEPEGNTGTLRELLDWYAYQIKNNNLYGAANWYSPGGQPLISSARVDGLGPISSGSFNIASVFRYTLPANSTLYLRQCHYSLNTDLRLQIMDSAVDEQFLSADNAGQENPYQWIDYNSTGSPVETYLWIRIYNSGAGSVSTQGTDNYTCIFSIESGVVTTTTTGAP